MQEALKSVRDELDFDGAIGILLYSKTVKVVEQEKIIHMKISSKRQVAIPKKVLEALKLSPGDEVDFVIEGDSAKIIPIKTIKVPRDQAWFWTPEWLEKEREADMDIKQGRYKDFETVEDLLKDIHGEN